MAPDWLVYWLTRPLGLAFIALAIAVPFALWRLVLGPQFTRAGFAPLAAGYIFAALGLVLVSFTWSYFEFNSRVAAGGLAETQRWTIVPGWSIYFVILSLAAVLPILGLIATPASAWLVKKKCLSYGSIAVSLLTVSTTLAVLMWSFPSNEWHRTNRLESLGVALSTSGVSTVTVGAPFLLGIFIVIRRRER